MTHEQFEQAAHYWDHKEQSAMPQDALKKEGYSSRQTLTLDSAL